MEKMDEVNMDDTCITQHPVFRNVCLDKWVLETAAIGLKTRKRKSYTTLFKEGIKSEPEYTLKVISLKISEYLLILSSPDKKRVTLQLSIPCTQFKVLYLKISAADILKMITQPNLKQVKHTFSKRVTL